jgi:lysophospholipase L1-like esterase
MRMTRRGFMRAAPAGTMVLGFRVSVLEAQAQTESTEVVWNDVRDWGVEGRGWSTEQLGRYYDRLPARAEGVVREPVWDLSRDSAGMLTAFQTDAPEIHVRYRLFRDRIAMPHMPATGVSGVDLYGRDPSGVWRWVAVARPVSREVTVKLTEGLDSGDRAYRLYLPLYNGVDSLEIGVPKEARFQPVDPRAARPLLFYGTSITHGACASRPGMPHAAILGRRFDLPILNLGFSGNGRMEPEVGELLCELDPAVYVIDCLPNMTPEQVAERAEPLVRQLRSAREETPILLVEDRTFTNAWIKKAVLEAHELRRRQLRQAFDRLVREGVPALHYLEGDRLLGDDAEAATDGSHPSDLGFMRQADAFEQVLRRILG